MPQPTLPVLAEKKTRFSCKIYARISDENYGVALIPAAKVSFFTFPEKCCAIFCSSFLVKYVVRYNI